MIQHQRVVIIGLGLMGGSLAAALRKRHVCHQVVGVSRKAETLEKAITLGIVDNSRLELAAAVSAADIVVLATPIGSYRALLEQIKPHLRPETILTDVGSVKGPVIHTAQAVFGELPARFVPGHPIAGSERSGVSASDPALFENHLVLLTPTATTCRESLQVVTEMWQAVGAKVKRLDAFHHDDVLAATSHLPHLLAYSLVDSLAGASENREIFEYAAGGFRDFTRIAASDPTMWHDIFQSNQGPILEALNQFQVGLDTLKEAIEKGDSDAILGIATRAKAAREHFSVVLAERSYTEQPSSSLEISDPMDHSQDHSFQGKSDMSKKSSLSYFANPCQSLNGVVRVPGDKSISHRAVMLGSLAEGVTRVSGWLEGEDALATLQAFRDMGVVIEGPTEGCLTIHGVGLQGLKKPPGPIYLGNSGTSMRLLVGLLAGQSFPTTLIGDASLSKRPMGRVAEPVKKMGAHVMTSNEGRPPIEILPADSTLAAIDFVLPIASAQVKSCLLLAGLYANGQTIIEEPAPTRDHTERMLRGLGVQLEKEALGQGCSRIKMQGGQKLVATDIDVPADISSAAFLLVAASIAHDSELMLRHVGVNPTRIGIINILKAMGAKIELHNERKIGGEPVADIKVKSARLQGIEIPSDQVPLAIDEFPVLFIAAACAEGVTILSGAEELRVKESDRLQAMADGLTQLGITVQTKPDGIVITGCGQKDVLQPIFSGGEIESHYDHRIAMAFTVASIRARETIVVRECDNVATSFPEFVMLVNSIGYNVQVQ